MLNRLMSRGIPIIHVFTLFIAAAVVLGYPERALCAETTRSQGIDWEYQIAYQRGIEAMDWAMPAVSMLSMRAGNFSLGGGFNTVYWLSKPPTAQTEAITANNQTPYAAIFLTTKDGPVILDVPPATKRTAIFGSAVDVWQVPLADIGPAGADKGKGGAIYFCRPAIREISRRI